VLQEYEATWPGSFDYSSTHITPYGIQKCARSSGQENILCGWLAWRIDTADSPYAGSHSHRLVGKPLSTVVIGNFCWPRTAIVLFTEGKDSQLQTFRIRIFYLLWKFGTYTILRPWASVRTPKKKTRGGRPIWKSSGPSFAFQFLRSTRSQLDDFRGQIVVEDWLPSSVLDHLRSFVHVLLRPSICHTPILPRPSQSHQLIPPIWLDLTMVNSETFG
jgi:hypothetical protein